MPSAKRVPKKANKTRDSEAAAAPPVAAAAETEHRNIARILGVLDTLAESGSSGMRLTDVADATEMGKSTTHRILSGMSAGGLVEQDAETGRFFVGLKMLKWANAARGRFAFARLAEPVLERLAQQTQDTVYLVARVGDEVVCLDGRIGAFPIKVLTLDIGDHRPLGIGAGSLSILAALPEEEADRILESQAQARSRFMIDDIQLRSMLRRTRQEGYAFSNIHVLPGLDKAPGMAGMAVAIRRGDGSPVAALHVTAITSRLDPPRRESILAMLRQEAAQLEVRLRPLLDSYQSLSPPRTSRAAT